MYKKHPVFEPELKARTRLWRYLDFTKLVSMLSTSSLFFCRLDKLEDRWEGKFPKKQWESLLEAEKKGREDMINTWEQHIKKVDKENKDQSVQILNRLKKLSLYQQKLLRYQRSWTAVNCWHENDHESIAMWRLYLNTNQGVAVETSFKRLRESFASVQEDVHIGPMTYLDYDREIIPSHNALSPLVTKRKSFEHEKEVRVLIWRAREGTNQLFDAEAQNPWGNHGKLIPVNINLLIRTIHVAPGSPEWFRDVVWDTISRYDLKKPVKPSKIDEDPVY